MTCSESFWCHKRVPKTYTIHAHKLTLKKKKMTTAIPSDKPFEFSVSQKCVKIYGQYFLKETKK